MKILGFKTIFFKIRNVIIRCFLQEVIVIIGVTLKYFFSSIIYVVTNIIFRKLNLKFFPLIQSNGV